MGTIRLARVSGIHPILITDDALNKTDKSSYVEYEGKLGKGASAGALRVIRWNDNAIFNMITTFGSALPLASCQRWDRSTNNQRKETVLCPGTIKLYNEHMGRVDLIDSLLGYYRFFF